jgi:Flp pilus assembly protein TadD
MDIPAALTLAKQQYRQGNFPAVEAQCLEILASDPDQPQALHLLGITAYRVGSYELAIQLLQRAIELESEEALMYKHLGEVYVKAGQPDAAIQVWKVFLTREPQDAAIHSRLSYLLKEQGEVTAALLHAQAALQIHPQFAEAHNNLGNALLELGQLQAALNSYDAAIRLEPDHINAHWNRAVVLLLLGDFIAGFQEAEWRWQLSTMQPRAFDHPPWEGSDLGGKTLLIWPEQGMGDLLQFVRYIPLAAERGGRILFECPQPLMRLLTSMPGISQLIPWQTPPPAFDVQIPLLSLPRVLQTTMETVPAQVPYLQAPTADRMPLPIPLAASFKIGIVWAGSVKYQQNPYSSCSCPLAEWLILFSLPNIAWFSLQKGPAVVDLQQLPNSVQIQNLDPQLQDFADTASIIDQLDLVITIDTSVAHLAGALGKPTWLLLAFAPDWRWMLDREDSPWYPTMRLFRQAQPGDWAGVLRRVVQELRQVTGLGFPPLGA